MKSNIMSLCLVAFITVIVAGCNPRIDFEPGQYGDHAIISSVVCFTLDTASHKLQEYYQTGELVPGVQRKAVNFDQAPVFTAVDTSHTIIAIKMPQAYDMTHMGIYFNTESQKIIPLSGAPTPGILTDLTKGQPFRYQAVSSNGFIRTYEVNLITE